MQSRAKASRLRSAVRRFGVASVATRLDKSPSTIRRWLAKKGEFPDDAIPKLDTFESEKGIDKAAIRRALKLDTGALVALTGVKPATARKWKREKKIPTKQLGFLLDVAPEARPRSLKTEKREFGPKAIFTEGWEFTTVINAVVTNALIEQVVRWGSKLPYPKPKKPGTEYQFTFHGTVMLGFDESLAAGSKKEVQNPVAGPDGFAIHTMEVFTWPSPKRDDVLKDLASELRSVEDQEFFVQGVTLWIRSPKAKKGPAPLTKKERDKQLKRRQAGILLPPKRSRYEPTPRFLASLQGLSWAKKVRKAEREAQGGNQSMPQKKRRKGPSKKTSHGKKPLR